MLPFVPVHKPGRWVRCELGKLHQTAFVSDPGQMFALVVARQVLELLRNPADLTKLDQIAPVSDAGQMVSCAMADPMLKVR
jgi:hypothetical protein